MSQPVSIEDIYKLFRVSQQEADRRFAEADRLAAVSKAEFDKRMAESKAEFDKRMAESKAEADRRAIEADRLAAQSRAEAGRLATEVEKNMVILEQIAAQTSKEVSALSSRWGRFIENFVEPGVVALFQSRGIAVTQTLTRLRNRQQGKAMEIDILVTNSDVAILVEVKSQLKREDIIEFIEKIPKFKDSFPAYKNYRIHGAVAGIEFEENSDRYAYQKGLFVIKQSGETVILANDQKFVPVAW
jgi:hypothetical protein